MKRSTSSPGRGMKMGRGARRGPVTGLALLGALLGCGEERAPLGELGCESWQADIQPLLQAECGDCHAGRATDTPPNLDDPAVAAALDMSVLDRVVELEGHEPVAALLPRLEDWLGRCEARHLPRGIHGPGIQQPGRPDFHGALIRARRYDMDSCRNCHGEGLDGGKANASCLGCHPAGPEACSSCHADPGGAHAAHATSPLLDRPVVCADCHRMPESLLSPGHVVDAQGRLDLPPAEVVMTGSAAWGRPSLQAPIASGTPSYDPRSKACSNVYCHGDPLRDPAARRPRPEWRVGAGLDCESCHGAPPAEHPSERCGDCHGASASSQLELAGGSAHLDGRWSFASDEGCGRCHGGPESGSPPPDLDGTRDRSAPGVGAHAAHASPPSPLSGPTPCSACHVVPDAVLEPGHIDSARPAEVVLGGAGFYDPVASTCRDGPCHGARPVRWTGFGTGQVYCGSCHGVPPEGPAHVGVLALSDCVRCHPSSVDRFGNILVDEGGSDHVNGVVDVTEEGP